ncbi:MAG: sugar-binding domain-containing protein [Lachnospiraceae bacterium]
MKHQLKKRFLSSALAGILVLSGICFPTHAEETGTVAGEMETVKVSFNTVMERENNFNEGWKFYLGTSNTAQNMNFDDSGWNSISLPHDFSISQSFTTSGEAESGFLPGGTGWYRKTFTLPKSCSGKTLVLNFDGVYSDAYVYVNGTQVGENHYGYTSFAFDITDYVTCDGATENVIAVKAVNNIPSSRWYSGSGIYRDVTLIVTEPVHVQRYGTKVTTPDIANGEGTVNIRTEVVNDGDSSVSAVVRNTVYDASGNAVSVTHETEKVTVDAGKSATAEGSTSVSNPTLWSLDTPNLYTVHTEVLVDGTVTDSYNTIFGFRYFSFDSTGFHLNGENVKINGVCLHDDQGALGSAAYYDAMYRQLTKMKDMGVTAVRTSHNPHDRQFMEICNEIGLLVVEDCFDAWSVAKNGNTNDFSKYFLTKLTADNQIIDGDSNMTWGEFAMRSLVKRDRNDPCLILYSLANEVQEGAGASSDFLTIVDFLLDAMNEEDGTRPATMSDNTSGSNTTVAQVIEKIMNNPSSGVIGYNYASADTLDEKHKNYDVILSSETSSAVNSRSQYKSQASASAVDGNYHLTSYDTSAVGWGMTAHDSLYTTMTRDFVAGEFVWTGFDYIGEPTPWNGTGTGSVSGSGAVPNSSYFGIVDTAGFEKDTYYFYRSQWNQSSTTLHLVTAWDSDNMMMITEEKTTEGKTPVVIYSNAPKVELYRNGTLIGTAARTVHTTVAGYQYYTYNTESVNSSVCTAVSASGSASLYATFNVAYEAGTISAKAYDENGTEITTDIQGKASVSTPGTVSKLLVKSNKETISADGSSLAYIEVEVQDENGILDTTAANIIKFELSGNGEIVGVDNGDQATTEKYQQSSVLISTTSAQINAYAGKALVIVRSTKDAGSFDVNVTSSNLTGGSVTVETTATEDGTVEEGLVSYTMVRDYTVKVGTKPELQTTATGTMADGTTVTGTLIWSEISEEMYTSAGDYSVTGTLTFEGMDPISVTCKLHVIDKVIAMRNISTVTIPGIVPNLLDQVKGVLADGTLSGEFKVTWESMSAEQFETVGSVVVVNGTAAVIGSETLPVTASIRVAEAINTESKNIAPEASSLTQDIEKDNQSDNLNSINNGTTKPSDNTSERWSNWNNRTVSDTATLTFSWATAHLIDHVNLYYYYDNCAAKPASVRFEYSLNGQDFVEVEATERETESYNLGAEYTYQFSQVVNPVALRIIVTQQDGTTGNHCVALTEVEIMTYLGTVEYHTSAALSDLAVDGTTVEGFAADTMEYEVESEKDEVNVTASSTENAGITMLPILNNLVRILTVSEDGSASCTYTVSLVSCSHSETEIRNHKDATCTEEGYTGDTVCTKCGLVIQQGTAIATTEHTYNDGVVTQEPTTEEDGVKTYTCTVCGAEKTEVIPKLEEEVTLTVPKVTVSAQAAANGKIALTGKFEDYENSGKYFTVTAHGLVYYSSSKLGTRNLTVNTAGRTRVNFSSYKEDGSFTYNMKPAYASTNYTVRAFLEYKDENGRTMYAYSDPIIVSYNSLNK